MTDRVVGVVDREQRPEDWNEETGTYDPPVDEVYSGRARLRFGNAQSREDDFQGDDTATAVGVLSLPNAGSADVKVGAVFTVTESIANPNNVGTKVRVKGVQPTTYATARRFQVEHYS